MVPSQESNIMMQRFVYISLALCSGLAFFLYSSTGTGQPQPQQPSEAVQEAQSPRQVESKRPEQQKTKHDQSDVFDAANAASSSQVFESQPDHGKMLGFDFARDPLNAKRPMQPAEEIMKNDIAD